MVGLESVELPKLLGPPLSSKEQEDRCFCRSDTWVGGGIAGQTAGTEAEECHAVAAAYKDAGLVRTRE